MTTLPDRPNSALIVIDVQNGVVTGAHERDAVVANIAGLVKRARTAEIPVVWVQHVAEDLVRGSDDWQIVPELTPEGTETMIESITATPSKTPRSRRSCPTSASAS
jgi:nicotinamidase-related amidase